MMPPIDSQRGPSREIIAKDEMVSATAIKGTSVGTTTTTTTTHAYLMRVWFVAEKSRDNTFPCSGDEASLGTNKG